MSPADERIDAVESDEILAAWIEEAERRADAYERGEMGAIDFDESIARVRARITSQASANKAKPRH